MEKKGATRDGGAIWDRMGNIACWNTVMDEDRYLTQALERVRLVLTCLACVMAMRSDGGRTGRRRLRAAGGPDRDRRCRRAGVVVAGRAAGASCSLLFFGLPMLVVLAVSFFDFDRSDIIPAFIFDNYVELFRSEVTLRLYLSSIKFALIVWADHLRAGLQRRLFPGVPRPQPALADRPVPALHRAVLDLEHHPHDLVDPVPRPQRHLQPGADGRRRHPASRWSSCCSPTSPWSSPTSTCSRCSWSCRSSIRWRASTRALLEAARDAGASRWRVVWEIVLPLSQDRHRAGLDLRGHAGDGRFLRRAHHERRPERARSSRRCRTRSRPQYPPAAASAVILLIIVTLMVAAILRLVDVRKELAR